MTHVCLHMFLHICKIAYVCTIYILYLCTCLQFDIYIYALPFFTQLHAMSVLGGDLAAPEQRGIVSAAMGVATSVGVASGDSRRWTLGKGGTRGGQEKTEETWGEDVFLLANVCLMFMESSNSFQYICRNKCAEHEFGSECTLPMFFSGMRECR